MTNHHKYDDSIRVSREIREYLASHRIASNMPDIAYEILALHVIDCAAQSADFSRMTQQPIDADCCDPSATNFDPLKAIIALKERHYDEACWLSFLLIYTDDNSEADWSFMRQLYSGLGLDDPLTWTVVNQQAPSIEPRLKTVALALAQSHPKPKFGHHRAYESLNHLPIVLTSYINFINEQGGHRLLFKPKSNCSNDSSKTNALDHDSPHNKTQMQNFASLYPLVRQNVYRFGRLSSFELICLLGRAGLANVAPDSCYIAEASGPKRGAQLIFGMLGNTSLDDHAKGLAEHLEVGYQEMEAALCYWQKSPTRYIGSDLLN